MIAALIGLCGVLAFGASQVIAVHRAQVGADMAAVTGAWEHARGGDACALASDAAGRNGVRVAQCAVDGEDVVVEVSVTGRARRARAGPL